MCLAAGFNFREGSRVLVNLPQSHVGGQAEELLTTLYEGGTAVVLDYFDPGRSLAAIRDHRVTLIGQIPAMFQFEWRHPAFATADLSSLETIVYGGQQVPAPFLEKLAQMAGRVGTGLGLTEAAGFCTYTAPGAPVEEMSASLGFDAPVYPMSIREPMREDGSAGAGLKNGETGHVCFSGPQTFRGYVNDSETTAQAISTDGYLYTGDLGFRDEHGLHLAGRAKWVIKVAGYQVFPGDVENHIAKLEQVAACGVTGAAHRTLTEAVVAFVEVKPGAELTVQALRRHARGMASYMRPLHYVLLGAGEMPLNRAVKVDYVRLSEMANQEISRLRAAGRWDV
jgi:acyl-CoA synthetase (AMP-forming)/AMP-acid ligase II